MSGDIASSVVAVLYGAACTDGLEFMYTMKTVKVTFSETRAMRDVRGTSTGTTTCIALLIWSPLDI